MRVLVHAVSELYKHNLITKIKKYFLEKKLRGILKKHYFLGGSLKCIFNNMYVFFEF